MMNNLFMSFDPNTFLFFSLNWISSMIMFLIVPMKFWFKPSRSFMVLSKFKTFIFTELKIIIYKTSFNNIIMFNSLMLFIMMNNFMGLFPYIFTCSSHLIFSLSLSLPLWLSIMWFGWMKNTNHMFTHLVPPSTPPILMPFMVLIESISNFIRPWTLAIRLSANMIAGHLILTLIGNSMEKNTMIMMILLISCQTMLFILELAVSIIQSYVFTILSTLYSTEV